MAKKPLYDWKIGEPLPKLGMHSFAKHQIFDAYITAYIRTLTKSHLTRKLKLTLVDGFCGGGRYVMDNDEVDGSPLRMLASVERAQTELDAARVRGLEIDAEFVFVDANREHVDFLREVLRQRGYESRIGKDIHVYTSKFEDVSDEIIRRIQAKGRAHRSLFFLDQYGWSAVTFATIRQIMGSLQNPEVVLTFMVDHLVNLLTERMINTPGLAAIDLGREDVRDMLQMKEQRGWKRLIQNTLYEHIRQNTGADYYTPFFIHPEGGSNRDYWLLHLSRHHQAREEMGKIHWDLENTFEHFGRAGFNSLGFMPGADVRDGMLEFGFNDNARTRSEAAVVDQLADMLHARAAAGAPLLTKKLLFSANCNETPVISSIVDASLVTLREARDIRIISPDGVVRRSATHFGWEDRIELVESPTLFSLLRQQAA
ncbi:three-Cys-motif partner protein TcmP [Sphingobium sp. DC-2]|uniref:three-Cys-motif partner protein TcmP n=1 Tax=Sphingobium sp. DC-2 TaxID=1303256 RepID=UPI0009DFFFA0|nr:three-Cys-motif partner protein TcmP [Sphingobium sp. DC-2]